MRKLAFNKLIVIAILFVLVFSMGCIKTNHPYFPKASLDIKPAVIQIKNSTDSQLITATITKTDSDNVPTKFTIKFIPSNPKYVKIINPETEKNMTQITSETLTEKGRTDIKQFKVYAEKIEGQEKSEWSVNVELVYNGTVLDKSTKILKITVV